MTKDIVLVVDVSPLWETQYTGIANVVYELTKRLLDERRFKEVIFTVFHYEISHDEIRVAVNARSGQNLRTIFEDVSQLRRPMERLDSLQDTFGVFLHVRPVERIYSREFQLYYDFSFIGMPETHHQDTIDYHTKELEAQVLANDKIFVISEAVARDLRFYFSFPAEHIHVVPLGFHAGLHDASRLVDFATGRGCEPFFICLGTIEPRKNGRIILAWISENREILRSHRFVFVGRDAWGEGFSDLINDYGLTEDVVSGRILHLGYVNEGQKAALIKAARGMIYPSLFEGFGLPVLEAMALEVPVIASCSSSIPEVLGPDGNYFDPYDLSSFDVAMRRAISEHGTRMGAIKLGKIKERTSLFTYDLCYDTIISELVR